MPLRRTIMEDEATMIETLINNEGTNLKSPEPLLVCHTCGDEGMNEIDDILNAKPTEHEPDRAKIKWPKRKKFVLPRGRTLCKPKAHFHPGTKEARQLLEQAGRNLNVCDSCGSTFRVAVHHRNGNPYDNGLENLQILCADCHASVHHVPKFERE